MNRMEAYELLTKRLSEIKGFADLDYPVEEYIRGQSGALYTMTFERSESSKESKLLGKIFSNNSFKHECLEESVRVD